MWYRAPVSKMASRSLSRRRFNAWAPNAPHATARKALMAPAAAQNMGRASSTLSREACHAPRAGGSVNAFRLRRVSRLARAARRRHELPMADDFDWERLLSAGPRPRACVSTLFADASGGAFRDDRSRAARSREDEPIARRRLFRRTGLERNCRSGDARRDGHVGSAIFRMGHRRKPSCRRGRRLAHVDIGTEMPAPPPVLPRQPRSKRRVSGGSSSDWDSLPPLAVRSSRAPCRPTSWGSRPRVVTCSKPRAGMSSGKVFSRPRRFACSLATSATTPSTKRCEFSGFGKNAMGFVDVDGQGRLVSLALRRELERTTGPVIVCAQAGNVNSGAFDPIEEIGAVLAEHRRARGEGESWLHIDGAFGLWARATRSYAHLARGAELADSWATDAHKFLNVPYDCGIALTRHPRAHRRAMAIQGPYLSSGAETAAANPGVFALELSRRARGFALWAALRQLGSRGLDELVTRCCELARLLAERLRSAQGITILNDVVFNQVVVKLKAPPGA